MGSIYTDDAPHFAARKYPECFTVEEVRPRLGQEKDTAVANKTPELPDTNHQLRKVATPENHFLPDCFCAPIHAVCTGSISSEPQPDFVYATIEYLRYYAARGCWFCSVVHNGVVAAPPWDPARQEEIPYYPCFRMPGERQKSDRPDFSIKVLGGSNHNSDPELVFYVDEDAGKKFISHTLLMQVAET
jgi:hypothetical protein